MHDTPDAPAAPNPAAPTSAISIPAASPPAVSYRDPVGDEIAELCAHIDAAQYRLLTLLRRYDEEELWSGWRSCAHWLNWRAGISLGAARERLRAARRLADLPLTSAEMEKGRLSWSKVRALTRMATPENEAQLVEFALYHTASQVERLVQAWRSAEAAFAARDGTPELAELTDRRHLTVRLTADGMYEVRGLLLPEVGALLVETLDAAGDELHRQERAMKLAADTAMGEPDPAAPAPRPTLAPRPTQGERRHDALGAWLGGRAEAKVQLVVHTVAGGSEILATEDGSHVPVGTSRRLICDAETVEVKRAPAGSVLDVGRRQRTVGWRLRKALDVRDGGCRFPGCGSRYTQAHHAIPWSEGGETKLDNLILLCRFHHKAVHEGGWRVEMEQAGAAPGAARFRDPTGCVVPAVPPAREDVRAPRTADAGLRNWHRQKGIDPWTATSRWLGDPLDLDWALWVLWGQYDTRPLAA
ncbi:DUF222 domain-containing protein [Candidatus Palauibacter soopunensis]|uniref:HNH endonuclease signature motif containing protein n=1 Tax=Candidatus Palauibacter soopunensis TaxID=3056739 RepID=UPI002385828E|nr:DUF222 domain-containing protein [Candidatus Palauibacter soopunensis]MDE2878835.1 DUF222 domain-containing protein [Candidatus Palauibacter soopunensis]